LREQYSVQVFRKWMLGKVFGPERDERAGDWKKELNEELRD
jgi:hypothetical protein